LQQLLWVFDSTALGVVWDALWEKVTVLELLPTSLMIVKPSTLFPYQHTNEVALICESGSAVLKVNKTTGAELCCHCHLCGQKVDGASNRELILGNTFFVNYVE